MPIVYLDANVPLNSILREKDSSCSEELLQKIQSGEVEALSSAITLSEISGAVSRRTGEIKDALEFTKTLYAIPNLLFVPLTLPLAKQAYKDAANFKLRGMDAIHYASALKGKADFFITLDREFRKQISDQSKIKIVSPQEFLQILTSGA